MEIENLIRTEAFKWLAEQKRIYGDVLPRKILEKGFDFQGKQISLVSPQGIFKPKILKYPLSITTAPKGPYDDVSKKGLLVYRYRGQNPNHPDNVGLRQAFENKLPLVYFFGIAPGKYMATWPVYIIQDNKSQNYFTVALDDIVSLRNEANIDNIDTEQVSEIRRAYITSQVKSRIHQNIFRERVLHAYKSQCTFCSLKHEELLDAAHIIPDSEPEGKAEIVNGLSLCKLHHAAFDSFFIGVSPDYKIIVRKDILQESDGNMLQYGIKKLHNTNIILPTNKNFYPKQENLEWRFSKFLKAV